MRPLLRLGILLVALTSRASAGDIRLNQIQVIGTHNSYHIAPSPAVMDLIARGGRARANHLDYTHKPLRDQFSDQGIRQIELDVFADPMGGLFAEPSFRKIVAALGQDAGPDPDAGGVLRKPGMKVLHIQDLDFRSTVPTFASALREIHDWSRDHPRHVPILILVELKDEAITGLPTQPVRIDAGRIESLEDEIHSILPRSKLLTPDDIRGESETLPEAISARGWPTLETVRGKILLALDNEGRLRDLYLDGHPALRGRLMFATAPSLDHPAAAWFKINDPVHDFARIQEAVRRGFLVRTRADADTAQARKNDVSQRDRALASGAQFISTDFPVPRAEFSDYRVAFPGGAVARKNPVNAPGDAPDGELDGEARRKR